MYSHPETDAVYPFISIHQNASTVSNIGLGRTAGVTKTSVTDTFTGDGVKTDFQLTNGNVQYVALVECSWLDPTINVDYNYFSLDKMEGIISFRSGNTPPAGSTLTVTYLCDPDDNEKFGYRISPSYAVTCWARKSSQNSPNDEQFVIEGEKMANGRLVDYLAELVVDRITEDYTRLRAKNLQVKVLSYSDTIYDPETRLFARQINVEVTTDFVVKQTDTAIAEIDKEYTVGGSF
jgi:hypothetical protein